ncbi:MAG: hypothetical protein JXR60_03870, partial [Bacteroidales bacterium]|nr:hypothetical protein [Bacteroidales bacterium]
SRFNKTNESIEAFHILSDKTYFSGNVGIGVQASSTDRFYVKGNAVVKGETDLGLIAVYENNPTTRRRINIGVQNGEAYIQHTYATSGTPFNFKYGDATVMTLLNSYVGIGTINPSAKLEVSSTSYATSVGLKLHDTGTGSNEGLWI